MLNCKNKSLVVICAAFLMISQASLSAQTNPSADPDRLGGWHLVARDDFTALGRFPWLVAGKRYHYSETDIPLERFAAADSVREIVYDEQRIELRFRDLGTEAAYRIRVTFLSNSHDRIVRISADDSVLQDRLELPYGEVVHQMLELPPESCRDGEVSLTVTKISGLNAVLAGIELWSSDPALLPILDLSVTGDLKGHVTGRLCDSVGQPVPQARVDIAAGGKEPALTAQTDQQGRFLLTIPRRWYQDKDQPLRIAAAKDVLRVEQDISLDEVYLPRLTPPPVVVAGTENSQLSLNGTWRFHPDPPPDFFMPGRGEGDGWVAICVPGEWAMQGFAVKPHSAGGYLLNVSVPEDWRDRRIKIRFDAVYSTARVWVNGRYLASHRGPFTPFEVDATEALVPGRDNLLALAVTSEGLGEDLVAGHIMVGHQMGGIIRRVSMFAVPQLNIASFHISTVFDDQFRDATLRVALQIANQGPHDVEEGVIRFQLCEAGAGGSAVTLERNEFPLPAIKAGDVLDHSVEIPVTHPKPWNAECPHLYVLKCLLETGDTPLQTVQRRFGFRQVEVRGRQLLLNGRPIRFRGAARQDSHPLTGRTVSEEDHRRDVELLAWANCNNAYTCAFSPDEQFLDLCDEMGLYVMEEPGTCWVGMGHWGHKTLDALWGRQDSDDPKFYAEYLRPVLEMIERSRSHPSVLTWMLADESQFGPNFRRVLDQVRKLDPLRPVHFAWDPGGSIFDIGSMHYPWYEGLAQAVSSQRPVIFDQFCHLYLYRPELMTDPGLRDYWGQEFAPFWEAIWKTPSMLGGQFFNFTDDVFLMPSGDVLGYGTWGAIDGWRRPKPELWHVKKTYTPVKILQQSLPLPDPGQPLRIPVENRYDFTNLRELSIEWNLGEESGNVQADIPPQSLGTMEVQPRARVVEGSELSLTFLRNGRLVDTYRLTIGPIPSTAAAPKQPGSAVPEVSQTDTSITVSGGGFTWEFDRRTGAVRKASAHRQTVLVGGPVLMILPHKSEMHTSGYPDPKPEAEPFNETCHDWRVREVSVDQAADHVRVFVEGEYREADGSWSWEIDGAGQATVRYCFTCRTEVDPRQIGAVFYLSRVCDTLSWKRRAQWTVYPPDHIGRPEGAARAFRDASWPEVGARSQPPWPWSLDSNALGTNDFRATRWNIYNVSLTSRDGFGIQVTSDGRQHARAFVDGDRIGLLTAQYSTGGAGAFLAPRRAAERRLLKPGDVVEDTLQVQLRGPTD